MNTPFEKNFFTKKRNTGKGFTLFEVILILIFIAIAGALIIARANMPDTDLYSQTTLFKNHIRYAQTRAMKGDSLWGIHAPDNTRYWLYRDSVSNKIFFPGHDADTITLPAGMTLTPAPFTVYFDSHGIPYDGTNSTLGADLVLSLNTESITITQETGFVP